VQCSGGSPCRPCRNRAVDSEVQERSLRFRNLHRGEGIRVHRRVPAQDHPHIYTQSQGVGWAIKRRLVMVLPSLSRSGKFPSAQLEHGDIVVGARTLWNIELGPGFMSRLIRPVFTTWLGSTRCFRGGRVIARASSLALSTRRSTGPKSRLGIVASDLRVKNPAISPRIFLIILKISSNSVVVRSYHRRGVKRFLPIRNFVRYQLMVIPIYYFQQSKRVLIMGISMSSPTSGFRKWSEAHDPKIADSPTVAGEAAVIPVPALDQPIVTPEEQPHRPWRVPAAGTL